MSTLDWLDVYRQWLDANERYALMYIACGATDCDKVREYYDYKRGYELLQIEYQSTSALA